jgi:hypothetical protein
MFDRFERPLKIVCVALAALLAWQLGSLVLSRDPLAHLKIPPLPALPETTNEPAKGGPKDTHAPVGTNAGTNGTNTALAAKAVKGTNAAGGTNIAMATNAIKGTNAMAASTNAPAAPGGMPGGRQGSGMKKIELPPLIQARVDKIIDSEIFGPVVRPMPLALVGIADQEAFIQATNGQVSPVKEGGETGGIKLLRIGINRVLVEQDGEKKELTLFDGIGGTSLMPKPTNEPSTNAASTNGPSTNAPAKRAANAATNQNLSSKQKETP